MEQSPRERASTSSITKGIDFMLLDMIAAAKSRVIVAPLLTLLSFGAAGLLLVDTFPVGKLVRL
ncbi:hypothetical protein JIQ42_00909 [Leishmania sp. Namibia]|uniref:hypothetical protein n=1 Tax=Leishmania sp. Namibia TaxID=2802991 RepID=UPI001B5C3D8C|nr:hypothetical protein JIQ42_00909 [Leishmania sp. Namibia]